MTECCHRGLPLQPILLAKACLCVHSFIHHNHYNDLLFFFYCLHATLFYIQLSSAAVLFFDEVIITHISLYSFFIFIVRILWKSQYIQNLQIYNSYFPVDCYLLSINFDKCKFTYRLLYINFFEWHFLVFYCTIPLCILSLHLA